MEAGEVGKTVVSTKGQVILPKAVRETLRWGPGTRLDIEEISDGVLLRTASHFAETKPEQVFGSLSFDGRSKSIDDMEASLFEEARRRHVGD